MLEALGENDNDLINQCYQLPYAAYHYLFAILVFTLFVFMMILGDLFMPLYDEKKITHAWFAHHYL
jgi:hypothetical protein